MSRTTWKAVMVLLLLMVGVTIMRAQTGAGVIQGTVTDPKGAVIPNARIHILKPSTGEVFDTVANSVGFYTQPALFVGDYTIEITADGMKKWETSVTLQVGQIDVIDAHLVVGSVSSDVTVVADQTTIVNDANTTQGTEIEREKLEQIPQNGRSVTYALASSTPGYEGVNSNQPRVNGLIWGAFSWSQDGLSLDYRDGGGLDNIAPDADQIQEMKIETSNSTAVSDRPGYAILSTKSGTNSFHGSMFEQNQDYGYGVAHPRNTAAAFNKNIQNYYGASVGGPVYLPFLGAGRKAYNGKDKSFFFFAWNVNSIRKYGTPYNAFVPTPAMRNGDFSGHWDNDGKNGTYAIYDPATTSTGSVNSSGGPANTTDFQRQRATYAGKQDVFDPARISPLAKALYAVTPLPTAGYENVDPYNSNNWRGANASSTQSQNFIARVDHHFNDKNTAYATWRKGHTMQWSWGNSNNVPQSTDGVWNGQYEPLDSQGAALSWNHISTPTFYQSVTATMGYQSWKQAGSPAGPATTDVTTKYGLQNTFGLPGLPMIQGNDVKSEAKQDSMLFAYTQGSAPWRDSDYTNTFEDALTWVHGNHQVQFGGRYRHDQLRILPDMQYPNTSNFQGSATALLDGTSKGGMNPVQYSGLAAADFFLGYAKSYTVQLSPAYLYIRQQEFSAYVQDDYHLRRNLTLNIGGRWQGMPALHEKNQQFTSFDFNTGAIVTGLSTQALIQQGFTTPQLIAATQGIGAKYETPQSAGMGNSMIKSYWYNLLPRVGVVWQPGGDRLGMVVRGGYGTYLYQTPARNVYQGFNWTTPYTFPYTQDFGSAPQTDGYNNYQLRMNTNTWLAANGQTIADPVAGAAAVNGVSSANVISLSNQKAITPGTPTVQGLARDQRPNGYNEWNVTVEQNLRHHTAVSASYVGNHGFNLEQYWQYNTTPSDYVWYMTTGQPKPSGTYAGTAMLSYNRLTGGQTYGQIKLFRKTGWSNAESFQANFQRLYYKGMAYQVSYVYGRYYRLGGNAWRDGVVYEPQVFMPGTVPTNDWKTMDRIENYQQDTTSGNAPPHQHIKYNWVYDIPVGQGRHFLPHSNRFVDAVIGGWELAGNGDISVTLTQLSSGDWGPNHPLKYYGRSHPITDCVDKINGKCTKAYQVYNGFVQSGQYNTANGFQGLPGTFNDSLGIVEHQPSNAPANNNNVNITLTNGTTVNNVGINLGPSGVNINQKKFIDNPWEFITNASLYKAFKINDRFTFKVNGDFFNVFNQMGSTGVNGGSGIMTTTGNYMTPRTIQVAARLNF